MDYERIIELAERERVEEANKLLKKGWVFVKAAEILKLDQNWRQFTVITYVLGRQKQQGTPTKQPSDRKTTQKATAAVVEPKPATTAVPDILSLNIQWRQKKDQNPNFYYAFVNTLEGKPDPVVEPVVKAINANNGAVVQNGWRFTVKNNFLQRSKAPSEAKNKSTA